jgi:hypothetical protein
MNSTGASSRTLPLVACAGGLDGRFDLPGGPPGGGGGGGGPAPPNPGIGGGGGGGGAGMIGVWNASNG